MALAFADITFTPSVKAAQSRYGSRERNTRFELADEPRNRLTAQEAEFIATRDSFYQATVSESGWPYVQHRGGPPGFLKVLDESTLGFADYRGNQQYLSVGNLNANKRIALILMDYSKRQRLKLWGTVSIVHADNAADAALLAQLEMPAYQAKAERGFIIHVAALDWNCPQHITPRYSQTEVEAMLEPLQAEIARLKQRAIP